MPRPRNPNHEAILDARAEGKTFREMERMGLGSWKTVQSIVQRARGKGDIRAALLPSAVRHAQMARSVPPNRAEIQRRNGPAVSAALRFLAGLSEEDREAYRLLRRKRFSQQEAMLMVGAR